MQRLQNRSTFLLGITLITALLFNLMSDPCVADDTFPTLVTTHQGQIQGFHSSENAVAWFSVPFAKPPVGDLRWRAPQPPEPWEGVLDGTTECEPCLQKAIQAHMNDMENMVEYAIAGDTETTLFGSEDCLYLNIFRPSTPDQDLPVYVFIHGGANIGGQIDGFDGSVLAEKENMVVVFVQYRLGAMGYFSHPVLRHGQSQLDDSGSFGTLDNIQALKWIQANIAAFGGNPDNVTVGGQSAGALNVMNLVISPLAKGLFHRAMAQSSAGINMTQEEAELYANRFVELLFEKDGYTMKTWDGWTDTQKETYLRSANAADLIELGIDNGLMPQPIQSPGVIPGNIVAALRTGEYNKVPIMLSTTRYELKIFMSGPMGLFAPVKSLAWKDLNQVLGGEKALDEVLPTQFDKHLFELTADFGSKTWRCQAVDERARVLKMHQDDIYAFRFDWCGPAPWDLIMGAAHVLDIPFFLGNDMSIFKTRFQYDLKGVQELSDMMMTYLGNFARTGNPNGSGLPDWQEWSNASNGPKVMLLDADEEQALAKMSHEELFIKDVRAQLRKEIATWSFKSKLTYGLIPYMNPLLTLQLQPEQIVVDLGLFGEYTRDTGKWLRKFIFNLLAGGNFDILPTQ